METRVCKKCGQELSVENFWRNGFGYSSVCTVCAVEKRRETRSNKREKKYFEKEIDEARRMRIQEFTPRELITELKRRGYEGKITYVETHTIDLSTL